MRQTISNGKIRLFFSLHHSILLFLPRGHLDLPVADVVLRTELYCTSSVHCNFLAIFHTCKKNGICLLCLKETGSDINDNVIVSLELIIRGVSVETIFT